MEEIYSMLKSRGLKLIMVDEKAADEITLDQIKVMFQGTKAVQQIEDLEQSKTATLESTSDQYCYTREMLNASVNMSVENAINNFAAGIHLEVCPELQAEEWLEKFKADTAGRPMMALEVDQLIAVFDKYDDQEAN